jgi:hypothetical protein
MLSGDAKLGLLLGIGVVVAAALVFYRPDGAAPKNAPKAEVQSGARTVPLSPAPKLNTSAD